MTKTKKKKKRKAKKGGEVFFILKLFASLTKGSVIKRHLNKRISDGHPADCEDKWIFLPLA
jgi:hypothetical protein